jgi:glycosyltransferase involved in cell wall biosynthesis
MTRMPKISVITVCYNASKTIEATIRSVRAQKNADFEHIIVDGNSTDDTLRIVDRYRDGLSVVVSAPDDGIFDAMNKGLRLARGEFTGYLNADDYFVSPYSLSQIGHVLEYTGADCAWGDIVQVDRNGRPCRLIDGGWFKPAHLKYGLMPPHPAFYARTERLRSVGGFSLNYKIAGDFDLIVRMFQSRTLKWAYVNNLMIAMRIGGASANGPTSTKLISSELVRSLLSNGISTTRAKIHLRYILRILEVLNGQALSIRGRHFPSDVWRSFRAQPRTSGADPAHP